MNDVASIVEFLDLLILDRKLIVRKLQKDLLTQSLAEQKLCRIGITLLTNGIEDLTAIKDGIIAVTKEKH